MANDLEPLTIVTYGAPKMGKTSDLLFSFPKGVFYAPARASLASSRKLCGYVPERKGVVNNLDAVLEGLKKYQDDDKIGAVVVDDIALISDQSIADWGGDAERNKFARWQKLRDSVREIFRLARKAPWHLVIDAHEVGAKDYEGTVAQGGPKMSSVAAGQDLAKEASVVLRAKVDESLELPWPVVYVCDRADEQWVTGDRTNGTPKLAPMNLAEILRHSGYVVERLYPWQEELVEKGAELLRKSGRDVAFAAVAKAAQVKHGADALAIRWTLRDVYARAYLREQNANALEGYLT